MPNDQWLSIISTTRNSCLPSGDIVVEIHLLKPWNLQTAHIKLALFSVQLHDFPRLLAL
jgi:hypothetical protein